MRKFYTDNEGITALVNVGFEIVEKVDGILFNNFVMTEANNMDEILFVFANDKDRNYEVNVFNKETEYTEIHKMWEKWDRLSNN